MNEISDNKNKMANSLERSTLETAKNEKLREDVKEDVHKINEQVSENRALIQKIDEKVSENTNSIQNLINIVKDLQSIVAGV